MLSWDINTHPQEIKVPQFFSITEITDWNPYKQITKEIAEAGGKQSLCFLVP
jgi:hypothetical protein